jgi:hypothetical protein
MTTSVYHTPHSTHRNGTQIKIHPPHEQPATGDILALLYMGVLARDVKVAQQFQRRYFRLRL